MGLVLLFPYFHFTLQPPGWCAPTVEKCQMKIKPAQIKFPEVVVRTASTVFFILLKHAAATPLPGCSKTTRMKRRVLHSICLAVTEPLSYHQNILFCDSFCFKILKIRLENWNVVLLILNWIQYLFFKRFFSNLKVVHIPRQWPAFFRKKNYRNVVERRCLKWAKNRPRSQKQEELGGNESRCIR